MADLQAKIRKGLELKEQIKAAPAVSAPPMRFSQFVSLAWPHVEPRAYVHGWHVGCIAEHLQAVSDLQIKKLVINAPPRHTKSGLISVFWLCWHWTFDPACQWIFGSYSQSLVTRDAVKSRDLLQSQWYSEQWGTRTTLRDDQNTKVKYQNLAGGYRISTTIEGAGTGEGADIIVTDDPISALESRRVVERLKVIDWWAGTMATRINDPEKVRRVVGQQRLDEGDLSGYLVAKDAGYEALVLPAEYEPKRIYEFRPVPAVDDAIVMTSLQRARPELRDPRKEEGQLLWPERYSRAALEELKKETEGNVDAQFQQRPTAGGGVIFRRELFKYARLVLTARGMALSLKQSEGPDVQHLLSKCRLFQVADTALTVSKQSDFTAVATAFLTSDSDLVFFNVYRARIEVPFQMDFLKTIAVGPTVWDEVAKRARRVGIWPRPVVRKFVEAKASGIGLVQGGAAAGIALTAVQANTDPIERAANLAALYQQGKVYHMAGAEWLGWFEHELTSFPNGAHDDGETAAAHAANVALSDALLRLNLGSIEEAAADYPEYQEYLKEQARREEAGELSIEDQQVADALTDQAEERFTVRIGDSDLEIPEEQRLE